MYSQLFLEIALSHKYLFGLERYVIGFLSRLISILAELTSLVASSPNLTRLGQRNLSIFEKLVLKLGFEKTISESKDSL